MAEELVPEEDQALQEKEKIMDFIHLQFGMLILFIFCYFCNVPII